MRRARRAGSRSQYPRRHSPGYRIWGFRDSLHEYSTVNYTKDIDDCANCHTGGGADEANWNTVPTREACGSCHDDVDFDTGANHPSPGTAQPTRATAARAPADEPGGTRPDRPRELVSAGLDRCPAGGAFRRLSPVALAGR